MRMKRTLRNRSRRKRRKNDPDDVITMVEDVIVDLGLSPEESRLYTGDQRLGWGLARGSAQVFVFLHLADDPRTTDYIQCISPVMRTPVAKAARLELYERLLQLNAQEVPAVAFGLRDNTVVLAAERSTVDMDPSELRDMILRVGYYADSLDDDLIARYGDRRDINL